MRARIKFTTGSVRESLIGVLKEHLWLPPFSEDSQVAKNIVNDVRTSIEEKDIPLFDSSEKIVIAHAGTDSNGVLSLEHEVWVLRVLNPSIHLLQSACQIFVMQVVDHAMRNHKAISFQGPIQIVERNRKETIIEGRTLATREDRISYARSYRGLEFRIALFGSIFLLGLLLFTYPWKWWQSTTTLEWIQAICEKFVGSIAVTALISYVQYRSFLASLRDHTIRWSIPGEPEKLDVKPHSA